jgi:hypothetical protein
VKFVIHWTNKEVFFVETVFLAMFPEGERAKKN